MCEAQMKDPSNFDSEVKKVVYEFGHNTLTDEVIDSMTEDELRAQLRAFRLWVLAFPRYVPLSLYLAYAIGKWIGSCPFIVTYYVVRYTSQRHIEELESRKGVKHA